MTTLPAGRLETEYLSSDSDTKANKPSSPRRVSRVNGHSRTHSSPRLRSRSPYRAPRGEKRLREEDRKPSRHDPRTFKVRYEVERESRYHQHEDRKPKRPRTYSPSRSRSRSRSRSPYRHNKDSDLPLPEDHTSTQSVSTRDRKSDGVPLLGTNAKSLEQTAEGSLAEDTKSMYVTSHALLVSTNLPRSHNPDTTPALTDEAAIIEARRRRREAIKNQYRSQATPLLVQALHLGPNTPADSVSSTPNRSGEHETMAIGRHLTFADSLSPAPTSLPGTPGNLGTPTPASPITNLAKEDETADDMFGSPKNADEPSAADYDPTADMQDERLRHDKRLFKEDEESEVKADRLVTANLNATRSEPKKKTDFDMFAEEEDEDDMFAEVQAPESAPAGKTATKLDVGMMDNWDDAEGYYLTILGEEIDDRYRVVANLGRGMFASVVRGIDKKANDRPVAIKIVRNNESMRKAGVKEVDILKDLAANDPEDKKHVVRLLRSFDHKGHLCMVFENMDMNLREVLKKFGRDVGINLKAIRAYSQQLFLSLSLMKKCQYLHADLKPDNILVNEARSSIKLADLGSASPITENVTAPYLVSRFYRAPEIILGIEYDYGIDMWSLGCTLFELYTGKILFTGRNNNNMLRNVMECRGKFPHKLLRKGTLTYDYFDDLLNFRAQEQDKTTGRIVTKVMDIKAKPVRDLKSRLIPKDKRLGETERKELDAFADLLDKCLDLRPEKRLTPLEALKHPFITRVK